MTRVSRNARWKYMIVPFMCVIGTILCCSVAPTAILNELEEHGCDIQISTEPLIWIGTTCYRRRDVHELKLIEPIGLGYWVYVRLWWLRHA